MIQKYIQNSDGANVKLEGVMEVCREGEDKLFNPLGLDNHMLLWHGSLFSNFGGILSQGLRIAPPEAPCSGYAYGKGVYAADRFGKSINYCRTHASNGTGILLLCQVALGKQKN
jgi:poly [ADP-ribose] polymerase